jgi:1-acyl-sn-glycerol-3-phosphate acyltransferase
MHKIISYPLSVLYAIVFLFWLLIFHPVQLVCYHVFGYNAHRMSVAVLNFFLLRTSHILGTTYTLTGRENLPENKPLILVCNHQSMHDIIPIIWFLRKVHPKFISKKELGNGIPSVSLNLRIGGSALIDRNDGKQALAEIKKAGEYINSTNRSMVIFPEGTRSKTGTTQVNFESFNYLYYDYQLLYDTVMNMKIKPLVNILSPAEIIQVQNKLYLKKRIIQSKYK